MGWLDKLRLVPWSDVIHAAPELVRGARRIFDNSRDLSAEAGQAAEPPAAEPAPDSPAVLRAQLQQLAAQVEALAQQQQAAAGLVESLTEHNARLIEAVQALRRRLYALAGATAVLAVAVVVLALLRA